MNAARGPRAQAERAVAADSPTRAARTTLGRPAPHRAAACSRGRVGVTVHARADSAHVASARGCGRIAAAAGGPGASLG